MISFCICFSGRTTLLIVCCYSFHCARGGLLKFSLIPFVLRPDPGSDIILLVCKPKRSCASCKQAIMNSLELSGAFILYITYCSCNIFWIKIKDNTFLSFCKYWFVSIKMRTEIRAFLFLSRPHISVER